MLFHCLSYCIFLITSERSEDGVNELISKDKITIMLLPMGSWQF